LKIPIPTDRWRKEVGQGRCFPFHPQLPTRFTMPSACASTNADHSGKVLKALREKSKGRDSRYGPTSIPSVEWPETLRVLTPAEGGDGKEMPRVAVHS